MTSDATRNFVWQGLLDMARYQRYYGELERRYRRRHQSVRFRPRGIRGRHRTPLVVSIPEIVSSIGGALVVALVIWDLVHDYGKRLSGLRVAVEGLTNLVHRYRLLWDEVNGGSVSASIARRRVAEMNDAALDLVRGMEGVRDDKLNDRCEEEVYRLEAERYAAG